MNSPQIVVMTRPYTPLPQREARSMSQRIRAANTPWSDMMLGLAHKTPMSGAFAFANLKLVLEELIYDETLLKRIEDYFAEELLEEGPKQQGRLL